ncbi:MAG: bifunctional acetate--CoA ligase family protein/GNAT family N-acetyltransferase [Saprospiraceae bacterium]|nr:bifunctional acetate--CoA ligase family protein/GNAT family N-acetyltransferase [Saprospiraceae bacterium]
MNPLKRIFEPKTVAVIGASNNEGSVGYALISNMIGSGFKGTVYPINFKHKSIYGVRSYSKLQDTRDDIDLAIIATPSHTVPDLVKECGEYGVGGIVIISAGFMEAGEEGHQLTETVLGYAKKYNMRIIGPNCLGFIKPSIKLNASFANKMALPGKIAFISQSGALCTAILDWSVEKNVGFSYFVSIGSMVDVGFHDLIDYFGNDPNTSSIVIYMESLTHTRKFMSAARAFARTKPIIVLKAGKSAAGAKVALSHTGTLAGNDTAFDAAFKRAGIIPVNTIEELFNAAQALALQPRPKGKRLAIVTNAGGPGVLATDHLIMHGGELAQLSKETFDKLNKVLPPAWSHNNPVDVLGDAGATKYKEATEAVLLDSDVDGVLVVLTPQAMTKPAEIAAEIVTLGKRFDKPILASWMGEKDVDEGCNVLEDGGIPVYRIPENAVNTFMSMYKYTRNIEALYETPSTIPQSFAPNSEETHELLSSIINSGRFVLTEDEAKQVLTNYEIPITRNGVASDEEEVKKLSKEIGFPVVMKIASPDITHKTDAGGVMLNIKNEEKALEAFNEIMTKAKEARPDADIKGVLVEEMINKKYELIIGSKKDPIFGPVIVFGMGGVAVEVFKDLNVGLPPLNMSLAQRIIEETKIYRLLKGYRGMKGADIEAIQFLLYKFAYLVMDFPQIKEIDINPFVVDHTGGVVLDAKIILDETVSPSSFKDYSHLVIPPYPRELNEEWTMRDGTETLIRPIKPEDEPMEKELFERISKQTEYFRFFGYLGKVDHDMLTRFTQIDYDREIALIAKVMEDGKKTMAGVVRLVSDANNESAEFAILVVDKYQGQGLGNKFMDKIMKIAEDRGIKKVYASVLHANVVMLHMFRKRGFTIRHEDGQTSYAEKLLKVEAEGAVEV